MMLKVLIVSLCWLFSMGVEIDCQGELRQRPVALNMTTTIVIPCHYKHFNLLQGLMEAYCNQTALPDEMIVSLSESDRVPAAAINELIQKPWPFRFKLVKSLKKQSAGQNRNIACLHSTGDLIITQDADDLPHPQRVELIKYLFDKYELEHLLHQFCLVSGDHSTPQDSPLYSYSELSPLVCYASTLAEALEFGGGTFGEVAVTNGNVAISRKVIQSIRWPLDFSRQEDTQFNRAVYKKFRNRAVLKIPLLYYRQFLSTDQKSIRKYGL